MAYPERIVPDATPAGVVALHLKRYDFARAYCDGADVLDAGCGVGYGAAYLAEVAASVCRDRRQRGHDRVRREALRRPAGDVSRMDVTALDFGDASFDVVTLVRDARACAGSACCGARGGARVASRRRVRRLDAARRRTCASPANPFHETEYAPDDFASLLRESFESVELYGQRRLETRRHRALRRLDVLGLRRRSAILRRASAVTGTAPTTDVTLDGVVIEPGALDGASEVVAVCRLG